jgi:uncharacterized membrane protein YfcA
MVMQENIAGGATAVATVIEDSVQNPDHIARRLAPPRLKALFGDNITRHLTLALALLASLGVLILYYEALHSVLYGISLAVVVAIFVSATMSSVAGFAFSAICGAFLFHLLGKPVRIVEIMIICSIAIQVTSVVTLRNAVQWQSLLRFVVGGIGGLPLGIYLLTHVSPSIYLKCIGVGLVVYGLYMLTRRPPTITHTGFIADYGVGFLGGVTGGFAGFPGAFVTIWCGLKGWSKDRQRGVYQPFILIMQVLALALLVIMQSSHARALEMDVTTLSYVPAALLGTWCGIAIFRRLTEIQFTRLVNLLLVVSGAGLIW